MSDLDYKLRCPFCNEGMLFWGATGPWRKCPKCDNNLIGNDELWQELITTRKALNIAVDALKNATEYLGNQEPLVDVMATNLHIDLSKALEQIKELTKGE